MLPLRYNFIRLERTSRNDSDFFRRLLTLTRGTHFSQADTVLVDIGFLARVPHIDGITPEQLVSHIEASERCVVFFRSLGCELEFSRRNLQRLDKEFEHRFYNIAGRAFNGYSGDRSEDARRMRGLAVSDRDRDIRRVGQAFADIFPTFDRPSMQDLLGPPTSVKPTKKETPEEKEARENKLNVKLFSVKTIKLNQDE
jgi:hypothetical protein